MQKEVKYQGHRGCRGLMPENTIPAFFKALEYPIQTLEMDVVISKDKKVVVSHEPFMNAEIALDANGNKIRDGLDHNMYRMNYDSISKYDVGSIDHPRFPQQEKMTVSKPLLSHVFEEIEAHLAKEKRSIHYNIEAKCKEGYDDIFHPKPEEFARLLYDEIVKYKLKDRVIVQSFDFRFLNEIRLLDTQMRLAVLVENEMSEAENIDALGFIPQIYSPYYQLVTDKTRSFCDEKNMELIVWTVNSPEEMSRMIDLGVDEIITDYPNLIPK
ncbi:MAG: glycerophosphodiester phosphodiesterase family protein [Bacteroidota bacterium]